MEGLLLTIIEKYGSPAAWLALVFLAVRMSSRTTRYMDRLDDAVKMIGELVEAQKENKKDTDGKHAEHYKAIGEVRTDVAKIKGRMGINGIH